MLPIINDIDIDQNAVIPCPAVGFKPRRAYRSCQNCEYFEGFAKMSDVGNWSEQFAIRCAHPIERRTQHIEVIEE